MVCFDSLWLTIILQNISVVLYRRSRFNVDIYVHSLYHIFAYVHETIKKCTLIMCIVTNCYDLTFLVQYCVDTNLNTIHPGDHLTRADPASSNSIHIKDIVELTVTVIHNWSVQESFTDDNMDMSQYIWPWSCFLERDWRLLACVTFARH